MVEEAEEQEEEEELESEENDYPEKRKRERVVAEQWPRQTLTERKTQDSVPGDGRAGGWVGEVESTRSVHR